MTVTSDLATLGDHDRAELPELHEVLRVLPHPSTAVNGDLVRVAAVYVERRAAVAWATTILISVAVLLADGNMPLSRVRDSIRMTFWFPERFRGWPAAAIVLALASIAARFARGRAERRFAAVMASAAAPLEAAQRLIAQPKARSLALIIASVTCFAMYFAVQLAFAGGDFITCPPLIAPIFVPGHFEHWYVHWYSGDASYWNFADRIRDLTILIPAVMLLATGVGWASRSRPSWIAVFHSRIVGTIATAASVGIVCALWFHVAFWTWNRQLLGSSEVRTELTVAFALSVFIAATSRALRSAR